MSEPTPAELKSALFDLVSITEPAMLREHQAAAQAEDMLTAAITELAALRVENVALKAGGTDAEGNYPDEIEFDPTSVNNDSIPGSVLAHWILKCHRKNAQLRELGEWRAQAEPVLREIAHLDLGQTCSQCGCFCGHFGDCITVRAEMLLGEGGQG